MVKSENPEMPENNRKLSKLETTLVNSNHYKETAEKLPIRYLSTILALITEKVTFRLK